MNLRVIRKIFTAKSTIGHLFVDGNFHCYTLEPPFRTDDVKPRAIPEGTYEVTDRYSPKHQMNVPHVEQVPGFEEIEIHPGNYPKDTEGCLLVGLTAKATLPDFIGESKVAWSDLYDTLKGAWEKGDTVTITYLNKDARNDAPSLPSAQEQA